MVMRSTVADRFDGMATLSIVACLVALTADSSRPTDWRESSLLTHFVFGTIARTSCALVVPSIMSSTIEIMGQ
jgi:hypothetical protein